MGKTETSVYKPEGPVATQVRATIRTTIGLGSKDHWNAILNIEHALLQLAREIDKINQILVHLDDHIHSKDLA